MPVKSRGQNSGLSAALHRASSVRVVDCPLWKWQPLLLVMSQYEQGKTQDQTWLHCHRGKALRATVYFSFHVNICWFVLKRRAILFRYDAWNIPGIDLINLAYHQPVKPFLQVHCGAPHNPPPISFSVWAAWVLTLVMDEGNRLWELCI